MVFMNMTKEIQDFNEYEFAEAVGRDKAIALLGDKQKLVNCENKTLPFDLSGTTIANNFYIEVKDRKCKSDAFDSDLLEYSKLKGMQNIDPKGIHYYLCFFTDCKARLYHLNNIKIEDVFIDIKRCPVSTVEDMGVKDKICYELPIHLAKSYNY
jgi:hypothetical protein